MTCARNFLRLNVNAERVFPIPPTTISKPPMIRTDHLRSGKWFWLERVVDIDVEVVKIDTDDEDIFDGDDGDDDDDGDDGNDDDGDDDKEAIW